MTLRHEGFVLVATLWLVAALALLAAFVDDVATANVERASAEREALESEIAQHSTEATLTYMMATSRVNHRGFVLDAEQRFANQYPEELPTTGEGELLVTDQAYRAIGTTVFSIQDENGLVSVNTPGTSQFATVLAHLGLSRSAVQRFVARIEDYVDVDSGLSLNGAERYDYERIGLPPPANWIMQTPLELQRVIGFEDTVSREQWRRLRPLITIRPQVGYNFNVMAPDIASAVLQVDGTAIDALLQERATRPIVNLRDLNQLTGTLVEIDNEDLITLPGRTFRVALWERGRTTRRLIGLRVTPRGEDAPWRKDYEYSEQFLEDPEEVFRDPQTTLL